MLRIFDAYGDKLSSEAWSVCIKSVIFKLLSSIEKELNNLGGPQISEQYRRDWYETAVVVLTGVSDLLANFLDVLTVHPTFNSYWQKLLGHFATLLDFRVLEINTATFKALAQILSHSQNGAEQNFNKTTLDLAWELWSRGIPIADTTAERDNTRVADNQACLLAHVAALREVYRLIKADLTVEHVRRMLTLLNEATQAATPGAFVNDIDYTTPLQGQVLDVLKMLRADIPGAPSSLILETSAFVSLAFTEVNRVTEPSGPRKRTFVAMSKLSMEILESLIAKHASDPDIYHSGAILAALTSLSKPIVLKYQFPIFTNKGVQPWRQATTSVLTILEATLPQLRILDIQAPTVQGIWQMVVTIANGVTSAECDAVSEKINIKDDEEFDIASFLKLHNLILPSLGAEVVPEKTRRAFAESLFRMSIIHAPAPTEHALVYGSTNGSNSESEVVGLTDLYKPRRGRTIDPPPAKREKMCYVCLDEIFTLVSSYEEVSTPHITIQPPTPAFPPSGMLSSNSNNNAPLLPSTTYKPPPPSPLRSHPITPTTTAPPTPTAINPPPLSEAAAHALHTRLARTAAPYLILRAALTLRAYAADQPLRGRMPQPLSQRRELSAVLTSLTRLRNEPDAIPDTPNVDSEGRKHLLRLYPLLVRAAGVAGRAGDGDVLGLLEGALEVVGGEFGVGG